MLVRHDFGLDGIAYVESYLIANGEFGKQLGSLLLASHDFRTGHAWAFIPEPLPADRVAPLTAFKTGGLMTGEGPGHRALVRKWLAAKTVAGPLLFCSEMAMASPTDGFLDSYERPVFFCGKSVISYRKISSDEIADEFEGGATWDPEVAVLTAPPANLPADRKTISRRELGHFAQNAVAVVIGAWDREGLVFWEPGRAA